MNQTATGTGSRYCTVCRQKVTAFQPLGWDALKKLDDVGYVHPLFMGETFNLTEYFCPACACSDRDRLYALYLDMLFSVLEPQGKIKFIDFAPAPALSARLRAHPMLEYRSADLMQAGVDDRVDITDMHRYESGSIDMFLCSHVLEHVPDDRKAMRELHRILAPSGRGILMVPIMLSLEKTLEDPAITSAADRWRYYGQDDHVRMYAKNDYIARLQECGFTVCLHDASFFGEETFTRSGIHRRSVLYTVTK